MRPSAANFSARELEIIRRVANGDATKAIAAALKVSTWTVSTHLRRIFVKLGVTSRSAMVAQIGKRKTARK